MVFSCFRSSVGNDLDAIVEAPRRVSTNSSSFKRGIRRIGTDQSSSSASSRSSSNASISKLPPCRRQESEHIIAAMMMPEPVEPRSSRCLRLSQPKTYSNIITSMKQAQGCRDWRNFDVFHVDDVDDDISADEVARQRAADCDRKCKKFEKLSNNACDMVG